MYRRTFLLLPQSLVMAGSLLFSQTLMAEVPVIDAYEDRNAEYQDSLPPVVGEQDIAHFEQEEGSFVNPERMHHTPSPMASAQSNGELLNKINALENNVKQLQGQIEVQDHELKQLRQQSRDQFSDLDKRMQPASTTPATSRTQDTRDLASNSSAGVTTETPNAIASSASPAVASVAPKNTSDNIAKKRMIKEGPSLASVSKTVQPADVKAAIAPKKRLNKVKVGTDEQSEYDMALTLIQKSQYQQAETSFKQFLQKHDNSSLAPNVHYWLGELYYQKSAYPQAVVEFNTIVTQYPKTARASEAMLKLSKSYSQLGKKELANKKMQELIKNYPHSASARTARKDLDVHEVASTSVAASTQ